MPRNVQAKQIDRYLQAPVGIAGFSTAGGTSDTITSAITSALSTASDAGTSVPLQVGSGTPGSQAEGVQVAAGLNRTLIYNFGTTVRYLDGSGNDVYGKVTNSGATWTLSYFSVIAGTETAFAMPASASISFEVPYVFTLADLPYTSLMAMLERHVAPDSALSGGSGTRIFTEVLTVTAADTVSNLTNTATSTKQCLVVNDVAYYSLGASPPFTVSGKAVTWNAANAGFHLATSDLVVADYSY